jgi:hypothetical protein
VPCVQFVPQGAATTACKPHLPGISIGFIDTIAPRQGLLRRSIHPPAAALTLRQAPGLVFISLVARTKLQLCNVRYRPLSCVIGNFLESFSAKRVSLACSFCFAFLFRLRFLCSRPGAPGYVHFARSRDYAVANSRRIFSALRNCHTMMTTLSSFCAAPTYISTHTRVGGSASLSQIPGIATDRSTCGLPASRPVSLLEDTVSTRGR